MAKLSEILTERGLVFQHSGNSLEEIVDTPRTLYFGIDPSADSLHIGNLLLLFMVKHFVENGHKVLLLIGGVTGRIGDPSGKDAERVLLSEDDVSKNAEHLTQQVKKILGGIDFAVVNNEEWLGSIKLVEFLRDIGKHFTINSMLQKENVKRRIMDPEQSISFTEFSYAPLQAFDYLHLHGSNDCTLQIGGSDQWGNITSGIEFIRKKSGAVVHGLTTPLVINKATGKKFGKSEKGSVWIDPEKTSPYAFYQFWLGIEDEDVTEFLKFYSFLPIEEIKELERRTEAEPQKREAQKALAREMTSAVHGEKVCEEARKISEILFENGDPQSLSSDEKKMLIKSAPSTSLSKERLEGGVLLVDILVESGLSSSKRDARQVLGDGGVSFNGKKVEGDDAVLLKSDFQNGMILLRRGKRDIHLIYLE